MLLKLTAEIAECYRHAAYARERANCTTDPAIKQDFLDMEHRWSSLARSYEFAEQLLAYTREVERRSPRKK
jgi:hypothetical protein